MVPTETSPRPWMFGHGKAAIALYLGDGEHVEEARDLLDKTVIAARTLSAAFNDVPAVASERIIMLRCQSNFHAAGPMTTAASVTRGQITMSAPRSSASLIAQAPK